MAQEFDRNSVLSLLQTGFEISLGAAHKSIEMARNPQDSALKVVNEMKSMLTLPAHARVESSPDLAAKAQALAGLCMEKGAGLLLELKTAGEKYTEGK
jgi:hypothetical protein